MENNKEDFNLKINVRNGRLLKAIRAKYESSADMARKGNLRAQEISSLVSMRSKPIHKNGDWRELALDVAGMLGCDPEDLWPDQVLAIEKSHVTEKYDYEEMLALVGNHTKNMGLLRAKAVEDKDLVRKLVSNSDLTPKEARVLLYRFGF